ncbi:hypothetical protein [Halioxenophilus sp. WMMB6]|uniref:hypothetical protein n=1 Tax=Halioxenophilus sp. WMMB6 TaxID=3073815 RepID=UPI00295EFDD0|nr:hypothetical protein [Halioxenophilus sp. WMMB6]
MYVILNYASTPQDEFEVIDDVDAKNAIEIFDTFNWLHEIEIHQNRREKFPSISVYVAGEREMITMYARREEDNIYFFSQCRFPGEVERFFGLYRAWGTVTLTCMAFSYEQARNALVLMMAKNYDGLRELFA